MVQASQAIATAAVFVNECFCFYLVDELLLRKDTHSFFHLKLFNMKKFLSPLLLPLFFLLLLSLKKPELKDPILETPYPKGFCDCDRVDNLQKTDYSTSEWKFEWNAPTTGWPVNQYI